MRQNYKAILSRTLGFRLITLLALLFMQLPAIAQTSWTDGSLTFTVISEADARVSVAKSSDEISGELAIPATVSFSGKTYSVTEIGKNAFNYCRNLTSVTIPGSVTSIGEYAFYFCSWLTSVKIPASVMSIGEYAFYADRLSSIIVEGKAPARITAKTFNISEFSTLYVPDGCMQAYSEAEYWKEFPNMIVYEEGIENGCVIGDLRYQPYSKTSAYVGALNTKITGDITIASEITVNGKKYIVDALGVNAFNGCTSVTSVKIPDGVTSFGNLAFAGCSKLTSVNIPDGVKSIDNVFTGCSSLTSINIPNSVTSISYAFFRCSALESVNIPEGITSIGNLAFAACTSLTSINIPNSVISIEDSAFESCKALASINISDNITSIGNNAFLGCKTLTSIDIPKGVTSIGESAFYNCTALKEIHAMPLTPPLIPTSADKEPFENVNKSGCVLYVPAESVDSYKAADVWKDFLNITGVNSGVDEIAGDGTDAVRVSNGKVTANADGIVAKIYTVSGALVADRILNADESVELPGGLYIIVANGRPVKAIVR